MLTREKVSEAPGVTQLLIRWSNGDGAARDELVPLVYKELRRLAARHLRRESREYTLQPTALVHDAYFRLVQQDKVSFQNRAQFFGLCSAIMRNILIDRARARNNKKRSGGWVRISLSNADRIDRRADLDLLSVDEALSKLSEIKPRHAQIVELRFFGGLTAEEAAHVLGVSRATVQREWDFARVWLSKALSELSQSRTTSESGF